MSAFLLNRLSKRFPRLRTKVMEQVGKLLFPSSFPNYHRLVRYTIFWHSSRRGQSIFSRWEPRTDDTRKFYAVFSLRLRSYVLRRTRRGSRVGRKTEQKVSTPTSAWNGKRWGRSEALYRSTSTKKKIPVPCLCRE